MKVLQMLTMTALIASFLSCGWQQEKYIIGVSQCSEDSWRQKLKEELEMATYFNEGVTLRFACAKDDSRLQQAQIDSLVESGIDLLIVSPNQVDLMCDEINKAYDKGIPVILFDRKTNSSKYTSFVGADNFHIGEMIGQCLAEEISGKGKVFEIVGLRDSSPSQERHDGFRKALSHYPDIKIIGFEHGDWTYKSGEEATDRLLSRYDGPIDAVFGGNDRMAVGARNVLKKAGKQYENVKYFGVDALPSEDGGIRMVADSVLTASAIYPTHGAELLLLALDILNGKAYSKETTMQSSIVTRENAEILLLQNEEIVNQSHYLRLMHKQSGRMHDSIRLQQIIIGIVLLSLMAIVILMSFYIKAYRQKKALNETLQQEKEKVERQRDELEEERDKLIELSLKIHNDDTDLPESDTRRDSAFIQKFTQAVEQRMDNPELSVEDISSDLCLSRVQLYRKVKSITGKSPVEIIREMRLTKADRMLSETSMNISEIAYKVGFSSASYFTKCYRDYFNRVPTDSLKK